MESTLTQVRATLYAMWRKRWYALAALWAVEGAKPDRWDLIGAAVCLGGAAIILFGPRGS